MSHRKQAGHVVHVVATDERGNTVTVRIQITLALVSGLAGRSLNKHVFGVDLDVTLGSMVATACYISGMVDLSFIYQQKVSRTGEDIVLLKVRELAKRAGLTIRALHYYDSIGLLKPSGRSESGYRLYNQTDVARLHGVQALRRLGLPLSDFSRLFEEGSTSLPLIISRQIQALDHEMAKAAELRSRLMFIQDQIASGINPEIEQWLSTLGLMTRYGKYFTADELRKIGTNWNQMLAKWQPLIADIRRALHNKIPCSSMEVQILARRWMDLSLQWMEGDFDLLKRWSNMCQEEPAAHGNSGIDAELYGYINKAIGLRLEALHRYLTPDQLKLVRGVSEEEWITIGSTAESLMQQRVPMHSASAKRFALRWSKLINRLTNNDPVVRGRLLLAVRSEPILQAGMAISSEAREYLRGAYTAAVARPAAMASKQPAVPLDPHPTSVFILHTLFGQLGENTMSTTHANMVHSGQPSASALRVAELRAVHQLIDEPVVFDDPIALRILGAQCEAELREDPFKFNDPLRRGLRAALAVRGRLAEEVLGQAVGDGIRQYVMLEAGLDTFAYRNPYAEKGLEVYEVDHPATQAWKKKMLESSGIAIPNLLRFVGVDFGGDVLADQLQRAGFRPDEPACFSWLGVTVYLTSEVVFDTLAYVASLPHNSSITFDYCADPALLSPLDRVAGDYISKIMAERGEPWISYFDPVQFEKQLRELGFSRTSSFAPEELNERFLAHRKDGLRVGGGFRMMCATV